MRLLRRTAFRVLFLVVLVTSVAALVAIPLAGASTTARTTGVVEVNTRLGYTGGAAAATGMVITSSGQVLTNNHVIRGATQIQVRVADTGRTYPARVLGYSVSADVALLKLRGASGLMTVSTGNSSTVALGDAVTSVGNAGGTGRLVVKSGTITGRGVAITVGDGQGGSARLTHLLETSANLVPGDSGGALLDGAGRAIGMNAAATVSVRYRSGGGEGYAIPINRALSIARQIEAGRASASVHIGGTPFLGISVATSGPNGSSVTPGVLVGGVRSGSPAARAGVGAGDAIVAVNGTAVRSYSKLVTVLLRWHPGDRVRLAWVDEFGNREVAVVKLASGPPQ